MSAPGNSRHIAATAVASLLAPCTPRPPSALACAGILPRHGNIAQSRRSAYSIAASEVLGTLVFVRLRASI
jgi:hypothetical protein